MTPDHLGLKVGMGRKAPPIYCHLFLASCSLQRNSGSIHADIWNRQDEDSNSHFHPQLSLRTYKYCYYYGWVTVNGKWGSVCHSQSACATRLSFTCKYIPHWWPMAATTSLCPTCSQVSPLQHSAPEDEQVHQLSLCLWKSAHKGVM